MVRVVFTPDTIERNRPAREVPLAARSAIHHVLPRQLECFFQRRKAKRKTKKQLFGCSIQAYSVHRQIRIGIDLLFNSYLNFNFH